MKSNALHPFQFILCRLLGTGKLPAPIGRLSVDRIPVAPRDLAFVTGWVIGKAPSRVPGCDRSRPSLFYTYPALAASPTLLILRLTVFLVGNHISTPLYSQ